MCFSNPLLLRELRLWDHPLRARLPTCSSTLPVVSTEVSGRRGWVLADGILYLSWQSAGDWGHSMRPHTARTNSQMREQLWRQTDEKDRRPVTSGLW
jgi:hypothetical protein